MYVAKRRMKADGNVYEPGDQVPADQWRNLQALIGNGFVEHLPGVETPAPGEHSGPDASRLLKLTNDEVAGAVKMIDDVKALEAVLKREDRKGATESIQARIDALKAMASEEKPPAEEEQAGQPEEAADEPGEDASESEPAGDSEPEAKQQGEGDA